MLQRKFETVMFCTQSQLIPKQIKRQPEQESTWAHIDRIFSGRHGSGTDGPAAVDADDLPGDVGHQGRHLRRLSGTPHRDP